MKNIISRSAYEGNYLFRWPSGLKSDRLALPLQKPCDLTCHAFSRSPHIAIRQMGISSSGFYVLVTEQFPNHFKSKAASETK
jgi:hypothetical protein